MTNELRQDLKIIADLIPEGSRVLDVGCGSGDLLAWLATHKKVDARGMEIDPEKVRMAIARGLPVIQGNAESDLPHYRKRSYDVVVLSRTLQAMHSPIDVLNQIIRISHKAIISIPNFGYWKNRVYLGVKGRMPVTSTLTYEWYDTPNIHFCTLKDFSYLCEDLETKIHERICIDRQGNRSLFQTGMVLPNLFAEQAVYVVSDF